MSGRRWARRSLNVEVSGSICRGTLRRRARRDPPLIRAAVVPELPGSLDRIDALIFTGGIGENSAPVRTRTVGNLGVLGAKIDPQLNEQNGASAAGRITTDGSGLLALVVATNEELVIARETARFL